MRTGTVRAALLLVAAMSFCALFAEGAADSTATDADANIAVPEPADSVDAALAKERAAELNAALREEFNKREPQGNQYRWNLNAARIEELLDAGADPNITDIWGVPIIHTTASKQVIELLLRYGADINAVGPAAESKSKLNGGGDKKDTVSLRNLGTKTISAEKKCTDCCCKCKCACEADSVPDRELSRQEQLDADLRKTIMEYSDVGPEAWAWHLKSVEDLLAAGADPNVRTSRGDPVATRIWRGSEVIELLIRYGADPNARNSDGETPMFYLDGRCGKLYRTLAEAGGDVNAVSNKGVTPLMKTLDEPRIICLNARLDTLLKLGADPHWKAPGDRNMLIYYFSQFHTGEYYRHMRGYGPPKPETVKLLLDAGINPLSRDSLGQSAHSMALRFQGKHRDIKPLHKTINAAAIAAAADKTELAAVKQAIREENRRVLAETLSDPGTYVVPAIILGYIGYSIAAREHTYRGRPDDNWVAKVNAASTGFPVTVLSAIPLMYITDSGMGAILAVAAGVGVGWWMVSHSDTFHKNGFLYYGSSLIPTMPLWIWYL